MSLVVRPVEPDRDGAAMAAVYAPHVTDSAVSFELVAPAGDAITARAADAVAAGLPWLVAMEADQLLGYAYAGRFRSRAAYDATVEVSAYVAGAACGRGIGRQLYGALFDALAAAGMRQAMAVITLPNPASTGFHESLGFRAVGHLEAVGYKFDRAWDIGLYQRAIEPARPE